MEVYPFKIIHVTVGGDTPALLVGDPCGYYCVFWRNGIPVGDLYIDKNLQYDQASFHRKMKECIQAADDQYALPELNGYMASPAMAAGAADVSVIICTRNRAADLENCLIALQQQKCAPAEIIVVDNAPVDDSTSEVARKFNAVTYVREDRPGLDIARNTGAKKATSSIVAYTDDDVIPHPLWIYHLKESFVKPEVMAMTGLVIAAELETESQQIFEKHWSFNRGYLDKYYDRTYFDNGLLSGPPVWEIGAGANMAFRKSVFDCVGYFDERLDVGAAGCNGDSEMWFRILAANGTIHYNPRAVTFHHHRRKMSQLKRQIFNYMRGFAAAALIQQEADARLGYKTRVYRKVPRSYLKRTIKEFPAYRDFHKTLFCEIRGLVSGIIYYHRHKRKVNG